MKPLLSHRRIGVYLKVLLRRHGKQTGTFQNGSLPTITHYCYSSLLNTQLQRNNHTPPTMSARTDTEAASNQASSGVTPESLKATLVQKLDAAHVSIEDLSGMLRYMAYLTNLVKKKIPAAEPIQAAAVRCLRL